MSIYKEQTLERNLGAPDDGLYYSYSSQTSPYSTEWLELGDNLKAYQEYFKAMGNRKTSCIYPNYLGVQTFQSSSSPRPTYNSCQNAKSRFVGFPYGVWFEKYNSRTTLYKYPFQRKAIPYGCGPVVAPTQVDWSESQFASNRAWAEMQPRFEGDFQALNFLYELKDFKNIASAITALRPSQIVGTLKRARAIIRNADRAVRNGSTVRRLVETARYATKTAAEVILVKHFAIDPLVRDLTELHNQLLTSVRDAQHRFRDKGLTANTRHYSETISEEDNTVAGTGNNYWYVQGIHIKDVFTATMSASYDYTMRDMVDAFTRLYGFGLNAGVVWNAIPFTFLVDYFVKVGDAIESMQQDPNVALTLHQYCESRLKTIRNGLLVNGDGRIHAIIVNGKLPRSREPITAYEGSLFQRRVGSPSKGIVLPRTKLPSVKQAVNIAALVRCLF